MATATTARKPATRKPRVRKTRPQTGSELIKALEAAWKAIIAKNLDVPEVLMITGSGLDLMGAKWAHFWRERWEDKNDKSKRAELFISGERLACGAELTMQSLLHEAAHAIAAVREEQDTSRGNRYHNMIFVEICRELGLDYQHTKVNAKGKEVLDPDTTHGFSAVTFTEAGKARYAAEIKALDAAIKTYLPGFGDSSTTGGTTTGGTTIRIPRAKTPTTTVSRNNIKAVCGCDKPRILRMSRTAFETAEVTCGACDKSFEEV
jgi:hypothetical protein